MFMLFGSLQSTQKDTAESGGHPQPVPQTSAELKPEFEVIHDVLLTGFQAGVQAIVSRITAESQAVEQLKAMGVCAGRKVQVIQSGDPMILRVLGTRLGVSARLAHMIWVHPLHGEGQESDPSSGDVL